jgi:hypothetical protein
VKPAAPKKRWLSFEGEVKELTPDLERTIRFHLLDGIHVFPSEEMATVNAWGWIHEQHSALNRKSSQLRQGIVVDWCGV